jgi:uncharacterized protein (DUF486 family)
MFARIVLLSTAAMFVVFGIWLVADPLQLDRWVGITARSAEGRTELRAWYGGLEVGMAAWLVLCALLPTWTRPGLAFVAAGNFAIGTARIIGFAADGSGTPKLLMFLAVEYGLAAAAAFSLWQKQPPAPQERQP